MKALEEIKNRLSDIEKSFDRVAFPRNILIEVTDRCNLNCIQCPHAQMTREKGDMDFHLFKKIIDDITSSGNDSRIWLAIDGEPLMIGRRMFDMISYAKKQGLQNVYLNTNGVLLTEDMCDCLIDAGLDCIIIGIDGYSADVYESIRRGAKRDTVYNNVLTLNSKMKLRGVDKPHIEAQFIIMDENKHELEQYKEFWASNGIAVKVRGCMSWASRIPLRDNIDRQMERIACAYTIFDFHVMWDGRVITCANDINAQYVLGDLKNETIQQAWERKNKEFIDLHFNHQFSELPQHCQQCYDWQVIGTVNYDEQGELYQKEYKQSISRNPYLLLYFIPEIGQYGLYKFLFIVIIKEIYIENCEYSTIISSR